MHAPTPLLSLEFCPSPAGLTTQVGFIRLAHLKCPKSGRPDFGWSISLRKSLLRRDGLPGQGPAMTDNRNTTVSESPAPNTVLQPPGCPRPRGFAYGILPPPEMLTAARI